MRLLCALALRLPCACCVAVRVRLPLQLQEDLKYFQVKDGLSAELLWEIDRIHVRAAHEPSMRRPRAVHRSACA